MVSPYDEVVMGFNAGADDVNPEWAFGGVDAAPATQPNDDGSNAAVMQLIKKPAATGIETWGGVTLLEEYGDSDVIADRTAPVTMRVWVAQDGLLTLKAEDTSGTPDQYGNSTSWLEVDVAVTAGWNESVSFDFSNPTRTGADYSVDDNYDKLALFPDNGVLPTSGEWLYKIDQVNIPATDLEAAPVVNPPNAVAPAFTPETADVVLYADAAATGVTIDPNWGQQTNLTEVADTAGVGSVMKLANFNYQGILLVPDGQTQDVSGMEHLRLDVWASGNGGAVEVFLISGPGEHKQTVTLEANKWNTVELDLSAYATLGADLTTVSQLKFNNPSELTEIYIDNLAITALPNTAPAFSDAAVSFDVAENTDVVYKAQATDVDGQPLSYALSGDDAALFNIDSDGNVTFVSAPDYEAPGSLAGTNSYSFTVTADDGTDTATQAVTVNVTDVYDNAIPTFDFGSVSEKVVENIDTSVVVHQVNATDADGDALTYSLTGADASYFSVSALGAVTFDNHSPDYETKTSYDFTVVASDGTLEAEQMVQVNVFNDILERYVLDSEDLASGGTFAGEDSPFGDILDGSDVTEVLSLSGGGGNDVLTGGLANDIINGGDGNDELNGGAGDDIIIAGTGLDRITGGDGIDTVVLESNAGDTVSVNLSRTWNYSGDGWNYIAEVENVTTGGGNDTLIGGDDLDVANVFDVGAGDDWVYAGGGDDVLIGGEGNDQLRGGDGNDTVVFESGDDLSVNLNTEWQAGNRDTSEGTDRLVDIENVTTGGGNDTLVGNAEANILTGGGGDDTLTGGDGADVFRFNASEGMTTDVITDFTIGEDKLELVNDTDDTIADAVIAETGNGGSTVTWDELTIVLDVVVTKDDINPIV